jgi:hypothetical protein
MIYVKKIINQDIERTPTFSVESIREFFKINLSNGQSINKNIKLIPKDIDFDVKFQKRETRDEYRVFLNELFNEINANEGDILIFRKLNVDNFTCEHILLNNQIYPHFNNLFENLSNHQVIIEDYENLNTTTYSSNLLQKFVDWFISKDGVNHNYFKDYFSSNREKVVIELIKYDDLYLAQFNSDLFEIQENNINSIIVEIENNVYKEVGIFFEFSKKTSNHMPRAILGKNNYLKFLKEYLYELENSQSNSPKVHPVNKIYFGAPGTGKSYQVTQDLKNVGLIFQKRVTFHPEYDNASFVGGYKPVTDEQGDIKYEFAPQIFTNIYVESCNDPSHQYYLIIEEINRGNCAEIFGEIFQLLDRDVNYKITSSNELTNYLNSSISNSKFYKHGKMLLPDNLSIIATMNTSDQSLFPMDSAFKRRWEWEYIPINYVDDETNKSAKFNIMLDAITPIKWIYFIKKINFKIQDNPNLGMDKCIGNYFVKPDDKNEISLETFIYKVIFYLWNDVFKDETKNSIFKDRITYQDFFPINVNGKKHVKSIFDNLEITLPTDIIEETNTQV